MLDSCPNRQPSDTAARAQHRPGTTGRDQGTPEGQAFDRCTLDSGNLARLFPGDPAGSATAWLAHALQSRVLSGADLPIDRHTSGQGYDIPLLTGHIDDNRDRKGLSAHAALAFGAAFVWHHEARPAGRTISDVDAAIQTEAPLPGPIDPAFVKRYHADVLRLPAALGMIDGGDAPPALSRAARRIVSGVDGDADLQRASRAGLFIRRTRAGEQVARGQAFGNVIDVEGSVLEMLNAPRDGWVVVLKRRPHVRAVDRVVAVVIADTRQALSFSMA